MFFSISILLLFFVVLIVFAYYRIKRIGQYPRNIFDEKIEKCIPKHPLPKKTVKSILKKSYFEHKESLDEHYDCIVIGSGISGMVTAGILSKANKKVLLLEQNKKLGGMTHCFKKKSYKFCVGVNFVVNLTPDIVCASDNLISVKPQKADELFEIGGHKLIISSGEYEKLKIHLFESFPQEKESLLKFFDVMEKTEKSTKYALFYNFLPFYVRWLWWKSPTNYLKRNEIDTTEEILNKCGVKNLFLRWFLQNNISMYVNNIDTKNSFAIQSLFNKLYLPKKKILVGPYGLGGDNLAKIIIPNLVSRKNGSEAFGCAEVTRILFNKSRNPRAIGVQLNDGKKIYAKNIISSVGIFNTMKMLPKTFRRKTIYDSYLKKNPYTACTGYFHVIFLGMNLPVEDLGIKYSIHILKPNLEEDSLKKYMNLSPPDFDGFKDCFEIRIFATETLEEEYVNHGSKSQVTIITPVNRSWFQAYEEPITKHKNRGLEYEELKENLTSLILEEVFEKYPSWESSIEVCEVGTNLTYSHYCRSPKGGAGYGICLSDEKMKMSMNKKNTIHNPFKNFFVVGGDVSSSCGIGGQMSSCLYSCGKILKRNLFIDLEKSKKKKKERLKY